MPFYLVNLNVSIMSKAGVAHPHPMPHNVAVHAGRGRVVAEGIACNRLLERTEGPHFLDHMGVRHDVVSAQVRQANYAQF